MRLLLVVHGYPPAVTGGAELRAERTARALAARGHAVDVLAVATLDSPGGFCLEDQSLESGVRVHRVHGVRLPAAAYPDDDNERIAEAVGRLLATGRVDVVHQFSGYVTSAAVIRAARARGVPVVVSLTDYWWLCRRVTLLTSRDERCSGPTPTGCARCLSETRRRWRWLAALAPGLADAFWDRVAPCALLRHRLPVCSEAARLPRLVAVLNQASALVSPSSLLAETYAKYGVSPERLHISRQGVDATFVPLRAPSPALRVGYMGQVKRHKGVDVLLAAWERLGGTQPRRLALYGSETGEPEYGRLVRRRLSAIRDASWAGGFHPRDRWKTFADLDVVVVPSRWLENSPNVVLEALAVGVVVVASRIGGIPELVTDGHNGLLVEPDSPESLAAALQRLLDTPDLIARLRRQAPESFRPITDEIDELERLYEDVIAHPVMPCGA